MSFDPEKRTPEATGSGERAGERQCDDSDLTHGEKKQLEEPVPGVTGEGAGPAQDAGFLWNYFSCVCRPSDAGAVRATSIGLAASDYACAGDACRPGNVRAAQEIRTV